MSRLDAPLLERDKLGSIPDAPQWAIEANRKDCPDPGVLVVADDRAGRMGRAPHMAPVAYVWLCGEGPFVTFERTTFSPAELETLPVALRVALEVFRERWPNAGKAVR